MTLDDEIKQSFQTVSLIEAFKEAYFSSSELRWKNVADLFFQTAETVVDFVSRIRKNAIRIKLSDEMVHYAILNNLRANLRMHVLQQGMSTLDATIRAAKIAETSCTANPMSALLVDAL